MKHMPFNEFFVNLPVFFPCVYAKYFATLYVRWVGIVFLWTVGDAGPYNVK